MMDRMGVLIFADGPHELGHDRGQLLLPQGSLPPLPCLVHRLLGEPKHLTYKCLPFKAVKHAHGTGKGYRKKARLALLKAAQEGCKAAVILIDRDGPRKAWKLNHVKAGRDEVSDFPCAVRMAIETFDAWMITDGKAVGQAGGKADQSHPSPETLDGPPESDQHPKRRAVKLFGTESLGAYYCAVAEHVRLDVLARQCPDGFAPFADEVKDRLGPLTAAPGPEGSL